MRKIDSIQFKDGYVVVEEPHKTHILLYKDMGDISKGWIDSIHSLTISAVMNPKVDSKDFKGNLYTNDTMDK
jgi:hypothetical protein